MKRYNPVVLILLVLTVFTTGLTGCGWKVAPASNQAHRANLVVAASGMQKYHCQVPTGKLPRPKHKPAGHAKAPRPKTVRGVRVKVLSTSAVAISWKPTVRAIRYQVVRASKYGMGSNRHEYALTHKKHLTATGLAPGTVYYFFVRAKNGHGFGKHGAPRRVKTHLSVPLNLSGTSAKYSNIAAHFTGSHGANCYQVRYGGTRKFASNHTASIAATSLRITKLLGDKVYYLEVRALDRYYTTPWSRIAWVRTFNPPLVVATFNVLGASHTARGGKDAGWPSGASRMKRAMHIIRSFDVVGLQEFQASQRAAFLHAAHGNWGIYPKHAVYKHHFSENSIIWRKSRFKLMSGRRIGNVKYFDGSKLYIPEVKLKDKYTGKRFLESNDHDPANTRGHNHQDLFRVYDAHKHAQAANHQVKRGLPMLVTGDFNSAFQLRRHDDLLHGNRHLLTYCIMTHSGVLTNADDAAHGVRGAWCPTKIGKFIDQVYVAAGVEVLHWKRLKRGIPQKRISDHSPTVAKVLLH